MKYFKIVIFIIFGFIFLIPLDVFSVDTAFLFHKYNGFNLVKDHQLLGINSERMDFNSYQCSFNKTFLQAMLLYQNDEYIEAESQFRKLSIEYPLCAESRAALTALLWRKGLLGEAESNWHAVLGLDNRYGNEEWLLDIPNWQSEPMKDLLQFFFSTKK